jgi:hypothetical protein
LKPAGVGYVGQLFVSESVEVECRECGKRGRVGLSFQYLTDNKNSCKRGLREGKALRCPDLLRVLSQAWVNLR